MRIPFILSALLLGLLLFLMNSTVQQETGLDTTGIPAVRTYDYRMIGLDYTEYDADGMPRYRLVADSVTHYPDPGYDDLEGPRFEIYRDDKAPWTINALKGRSETDSILGETQVALETNVIIRGSDSRGREIRILTDSLDVYPDSNSVSTDQDVMITGESSEMTGTGMTADLGSSRISLLANVRGKYGNKPD